MAKLKWLVYRYWFEDGLVELVIGVVLLAIGVLTLVHQVALVPVLMLFALLLARPMLHRLRLRLTYPRIGYLVYAEPRAQIVLASMFAAALAAAVVAWVAQTLSQLSAPELSAWYEALPVFGLSGLFLWMADRTGLRRHVVLAVMSVVSGLLVVLVFDGLTSWAGYFLCMGTTLLLTGGDALRRHLRNAPLPEETEQ